jgi:hypothetical protein
MPPLADRIGAPVARFAAIMREGNFSAQLGVKLFEAYPAGTLKMLKIEGGSYKGAKGMEGLGSLCKALNMEPHVANDHDFDAIVCAIAAAAPADAVYSGSELKVQGPMPKGFRIPKSLSFAHINVKIACFEKWMSARRGSA